MKVIIDTNIAFSAILNSSSLIGEILFNSKFDFYTPEFMEAEIMKYIPKLMQATSLNADELEVSIHQVFKKIRFISHEAIQPKAWKDAIALAGDVDHKDIPFVALTISLDGILWTGDKKLTTGLLEKNFRNVIDTNNLFALRS